MPAPTNLVTPAKTEHYFNDEFVQQVRNTILERLELADNNNCDDELIYDRADVERLKSNDDWFIRRFLKWTPTSLSDAENVIHQALLWRKSIKINSWYVKNC